MKLFFRYFLIAALTVSYALCAYEKIIEVRSVYAGKFSHAVKPAQQAMQVARLPLDAMIEISCIAFTPIPHN